MRTVILIVLSLCAKTTFSQEWVDYNHDSTLIVSMPYYHYERELNGLLLSSAKIEGGVIVVSHMPDGPSTQYNIRDTSDLRRAYYNFRDEIIKTQQGKLIKSRIIEKDRVKWIHFIDRGSVEGIDQQIHNLAVFVNDAIYILTFFEMGPATPEKDEARQKIFSSAKIAPAISKKQISSQFYVRPLPFKDLFPTKPIIIGIGVFIATVFLLVWTRNKRKSFES
jgi:hypothetical protein